MKRAPAALVDDGVPRAGRGDQLQFERGDVVSAALLVQQEASISDERARGRRRSEGSMTTRRRKGGDSGRAREENRFRRWSRTCCCVRRVGSLNCGRGICSTVAVRWSCSRGGEASECCTFWAACTCRLSRRRVWRSRSRAIDENAGLDRSEPQLLLSNRFWEFENRVALIIELGPKSSKLFARSNCGSPNDTDLQPLAVRGDPACQVPRQPRFAGRAAGHWRRPRVRRRDGQGS